MHFPRLKNILLVLLSLIVFGCGDKTSSKEQKTKVSSKQTKTIEVRDNRAKLRALAQEHNNQKAKKELAIATDKGKLVTAGITPDGGVSGYGDELTWYNLTNRTVMFKQTGQVVSEKKFFPTRDRLNNFSKLERQAYKDGWIPENDTEAFYMLWSYSTKNIIVTYICVNGHIMREVTKPISNQFNTPINKWVDTSERCPKYPNPQDLVVSHSVERGTNDSNEIENKNSDIATYYEDNNAMYDPVSDQVILFSIGGVHAMKDLVPQDTSVYTNFTNNITKETADPNSPLYNKEDEIYLLWLYPKNKRKSRYVSYFCVAGNVLIEESSIKNMWNTPFNKMKFTGKKCPLHQEVFPGQGGQ